MTKFRRKYNVKNILLKFVLTLALLILAACGGGGGADTAGQNPPPAKTTATLKINLTGTLPATTTIAGA
jgi:hypothetical protein